MLQIFKRLLLAIATVVTLFIGSNPALADEALIAKVGSTEITVYELKREMHRILPLNTSFHGEISLEKKKEVRAIALSNLIERGYKIEYALAQKLSVSAADLEKRLGKVKDKFKTPEALQEALGEEALADFRTSVYRMLLAKKVENIVVNSRAELTDAEMKHFYRENKNMYQRPKQYRVSHILIKVDPSLVGEAREKLIAKANDLAEQAKAGKDFYNLAYYNSDEDTKYVGGDIGVFHSGQSVTEFEDAIKDLSPGDITGPVETISGFHIIKLTDVQEPRLLVYEEVKGKIKEMIEGKKRKALYEEWMTTLKNQYKHEIIHPDLK